MPPRAPAPPPLDAADLTRRLTTYLTHHPSRRAAPTPTPAPPPYHHIPLLAASSFTRTATPDGGRTVHRLSLAVVQERAAPHAGGLVAVDEQQRLRRQRSERNGGGWGRGLEGVQERDRKRGVERAVRRSWVGEGMEGDMGGEYIGRGEWAQREMGRRDSVWTLRGRREREREEVEEIEEREKVREVRMERVDIKASEEKCSTLVGKNRRTSFFGFLARFRRQRPS